VSSTLLEEQLKALTQVERLKSLTGVEREADGLHEILGRKSTNAMQAIIGRKTILEALPKGDISLSEPPRP